MLASDACAFAHASIGSDPRGQSRVPRVPTSPVRQATLHHPTGLQRWTCATSFSARSSTPTAEFDSTTMPTPVCSEKPMNEA